MELKTPIRIYWDLTPAPPVRHLDPLAICAEILAIRALSLELFDAGPTLSRDCLAILEMLKGKPVAVTLTIPATSLEGSAGEQLQTLGIKALFVTATSLEELRSLATAGWAGLPPGICFAVDDTNYLELPGLLSFCLDQGITQLVFPIFRATPGAPLSYPDARQREILTRELRLADRPASLRLTIHDPFLWKVFYPEKPFPEGGCQAANTMLYIAPDAAVYPCPALPYRLGVLGDSSLAEITASNAKRELRQTLLTPPAECRSCAALLQCSGGCRGRGYVGHACWEAADPACR
jgi:GeoRSP system SPASM domain protein